MGREAIQALSLILMRQTRKLKVLMEVLKVTVLNPPVGILLHLQLAQAKFQGFRHSIQQQAQTLQSLSEVLMLEEWARKLDFKLIPPHQNLKRMMLRLHPSLQSLKTRNMVKSEPQPQSNSRILPNKTLYLVHTKIS